MLSYLTDSILDLTGTGSSTRYFSGTLSRGEIRNLYTPDSGRFFSFCRIVLVLPARGAFLAADWGTGDRAWTLRPILRIHRPVLWRPVGSGISHFSPVPTARPLPVRRVGAARQLSVFATWPVGSATERGTHRPRRWLDSALPYPALTAVYLRPWAFRGPPQQGPIY